MADSANLMLDVYRALRELASQRLAAERPDHTLQATALVHDVYVKLAGESPEKWANPEHFFNAAAESMRRILIDHARTRKRIKRGGANRERVPLATALNVATLAQTADPEDILALDAALCRLEALNSEAARVVRLRFYAGLSLEETASTLKTSTRTVKRKWTYARAWLYRELSPTDPGG